MRNHRYRINGTSTLSRNKTTPNGERNFRGVELRRKIKKKLKVYVAGEKNGQKRELQVLDLKIRYLCF